MYNAVFSVLIPLRVYWLCVFLMLLLKLEGRCVLSVRIFLKTIFYLYIKFSILDDFVEMSGQGFSHVPILLKGAIKKNNRKTASHHNEIVTTVVLWSS